MCATYRMEDVDKTLFLNYSVKDDTRGYYKSGTADNSVEWRPLKEMFYERYLFNRKEIKFQDALRT